MDKSEWKDAWERIVPALSFEDKRKIAEERKVKLVNGASLAKLDKKSLDDYHIMLVALWRDLMNQRKNKKLFLSWLNPYWDEKSVSRYDEEQIKNDLQDEEVDEDTKWRLLAALLLTRLPELQAIALAYLEDLPPVDHEAMKDTYIDELQCRIHELEKAKDSNQKKLDALEARAKKAEERLQASLGKQNQLKQRAGNLENDNNALYKEKTRLEKELQRLQGKQGDHLEDIQKRLEAAYSKGRVCWVRSIPHPFEESAPSLAISAFRFGTCSDADYKKICTYLKQNEIHEILVDPAVIPSGDIFLMQKLIQKKDLPIVIVEQGEKTTLATVKEL